VGTGFAVQKVGDVYVLVTQESNLVFNPQFVAYVADSPTGPFTGPVDLFTAPEGLPGSRQLIVYDAKLHPEIARDGKLLVSYNVDTLNRADTYADARLYRPRFVEVSWPIAQPDPSLVPPAPTAVTGAADPTGVVHLQWTTGWF
jgi:hypothetical protein